MINDYNYPILSKIINHFSGFSKKLSPNTYIWACQHILEPQEKMFMLISKFGIPTENIHILGKIYSTNFEVLDELKESGFNAVQPGFDLVGTFDEQHKNNCQSLFASFLETNKSGDNVIVIDDGAELLNVFNKNLEKINPKTKIIGVEQTSSGFRKLEKINLKFPVINVARSRIKLEKESPLIARLGCDRINDVIKKYNISKPRILVVGLGPIGDNVFLILKGEGYSLIAHDTMFASKTEIVDLIIKNNINIIIGATGSNILSEQQIQELEKNIFADIYLISMSSADREFPALFLRKNAKLNKNTHSDIVWKKIVLINNGFPITFKGKRYESTPLEIERTIALLFGSVLCAITSDINKPGLMDVPKPIEEIIQDNESN